MSSPEELPSGGSLAAFIAAAKTKGASDESLIALLKQAGWPARDVLAALRRYYEETTGIALPARGASVESARDAFLHLLAFCTLATWTVALGSLLFALIEKLFPDPVTSLREQLLVLQSIATEIASLMIAFPVYLLVNRIIRRESANRPGLLDSAVTRWLTWLALLIAAGVLIGDLITFLAWFLRGELSVRFVLKVLVVGALAGGVFWYYLGSLSIIWRPRQSVFAAVATACVVAAIIGGFVITGSPQRQRALAADRRRTGDIQRIAQDVYARWAATSTVPAELPRRLRDPVTLQPYEYRVLSGTQYEVCAVFDREGDAGLPDSDGRWYHRAGRHCYKFDARLAP
jgi:hypothetical protein